MCESNVAPTAGEEYSEILLEQKVKKNNYDKGKEYILRGKGFLNGFCAGIEW